MKNKTLPKKMQELEKVLEPYKEFWDLWIISKECFLKRKEIDVILIYRKTENFQQVAKQLKISKHSVYEIFNRSLNRLRWNYKLYHYWIAHCILESGIDTNISAEEKFLITPIYYHNMPSILLSFLSRFGETMADILNEYGEIELRMLRNFGKKKLFYLREFLEQNNCLHLLKKRLHENEEIYFGRK